MRDELAQSLMLEFADSTGVSGKTTPRRYLWTDAFAVCNFLGLYRRTGNNCYLEFARELVDQVHHILGRHREDDPRRGWISGLSEEEGKHHPARGGLRIGKTLNERAPEEPMDAQLEWDRDGQYFHYLTKWMHALNRMSHETGENQYRRWAAELATTSVNTFSYQSAPDRPRQMVWKMSIDLSRPLIASMGQHDPLDGLITCLELQTDGEIEQGDGSDLAPAIADLSEMCERARWVTDDPLGIGGLLDSAVRLTQLVFARGVDRRLLLRRLLLDAELSLQIFADSSLLSHATDRRLAFRELGLSIGMHGIELIRDIVQPENELSAFVIRVLRHQPLAAQFEAFWSQPAHRMIATWKAHHDINTVMLATSLMPEGYFHH